MNVWRFLLMVKLNDKSFLSCYTITSWWLYRKKVVLKRIETKKNYYHQQFFAAEHSSTSNKKSALYRVMSVFEGCVSDKNMHYYLLSRRYCYPKKLKYQSQNSHNRCSGELKRKKFISNSTTQNIISPQLQNNLLFTRLCVGVSFVYTPRVRTLSCYHGEVVISKNCNTKVKIPTTEFQVG